MLKPHGPDSMVVLAVSERRADYTAVDAARAAAETRAAEAEARLRAAEAELAQLRGE